MAGGNLIEQLRDGMEVRASDGAKLGKIKQVYYGDEPATSFVHGEDETCMEVHHGGLLGKADTMYVPCHAIADVSGGHVTLKVDAQKAKSTPGWHHKPSWVGR